MLEDTSTFDPEAFFVSEVAFWPKPFPSYPDRFVPPTEDINCNRNICEVQYKETLKRAIHNNGPLGFTPSVHLIRSLDSSMRQSWVEISACLSGKFHRPEADYMSGYDINSSKGGEHLIFYRRNMFGVAGIVTIPQDLRYVLTPYGNRIPITAKEITIATMESLEGEWAHMSVAPCQRGSSENTSAGGNQSAGEKPMPISLNFIDSLPASNGNSMFCFDWERLRFRNATKKNLGFGKPGQNFVIRLQVIATLSTGITVPIAETFSTPVIVRGQNPGQFESRRSRRSHMG